MAKTTGQKLKLLRLKSIFEQQTDEEHPMSIRQLTDILEKEYGIVSERKALYRDIEALREYGMNICSRREKHYVYYLGEREFEDVELKLLTDAVLASKFIPKKLTNRLMQKIGSLTSVYHAQRLDRQLLAEKSTDEESSSLYYNIDAVYRAINTDSRIQFRYFDYTMKKARELRRGGSFYVTSPWALLWNDGMYYLVGFDSTVGEIRHYRVDRMLRTTVNEKLRRDGREQFEDFDSEKYSRCYFGMYHSELDEVRMLCHKSLANVMIDRFGRRDLVMKIVDEEHFEVSVKVSISPVFLAWAAGFGSKLVILSPQSVREEMKKNISEMMKVYED